MRPIRTMVAVLLWLAVLNPGAAHAKPSTTAGEATRIRVRVVEVAGRRAYVTPGESAHLRRGDLVVIKGKRFRVIASSEESALVETKGAPLRVGERGRATVRPEVDDEVVRLPAPEPLAAYEGQWKDPTLPATEQNPDPVPLSSGARERASTRLMLSLMGAARIDFKNRVPTLGRGSLRARLQSEPFAGVPFAFEADLAAQLWVASDLRQRDGYSSRPPVRVYALNARYGNRDDLHGILGRMRYAATGLGTLDGLRVHAPLTETLSVAGFGGLVPQPLNNMPDLDTSRFGLELTYEDLDAELRPRLSATAHGSRFLGQLDERRLYLQGDLYPGDSYMGGYAQVSNFDSGNRWNASPIELTAAGAHLGTHVGVLHASARFDMQRPERSLWLASFLPESWLCIAKPAPGTGTAEPCYGNEVRYLGQGQVGLRFDQVAVDVGGSVSHTAHVDAAQHAGFLHLRLVELLERTRADLTLHGSYGSFFRTLALTVAPGMAITEELDISLRYRPAIARYKADVGLYFENAFGLSARVTPSNVLEFSLDADAIRSRDIQMLFVQLMTTARL